MLISQSRTYADLRRFTIALLCGVLGVGIGFLSQAWHATWLELVADAIVIVSVVFCFAFFFRGLVVSARAIRQRLRSSRVVKLNRTDEKKETIER